MNDPASHIVIPAHHLQYMKKAKKKKAPLNTEEFPVLRPVSLLATPLVESSTAHNPEEDDAHEE